MIGSKRHPDSLVHYPRSRRVASWLYQQLVRLLFRLDVRDTQVGLKVFRREVAEEVLPLLLVKQFAFDLELLAVARALGFRRIRELPVTLEYRFTGSGVRSSAVLLALVDTAAIFYRLRILRYYQRKRELLPAYARAPELPAARDARRDAEPTTASSSIRQLEVVRCEDEHAPAATRRPRERRRRRGRSPSSSGARPGRQLARGHDPVPGQSRVAAVVTPSMAPGAGLGARARRRGASGSPGSAAARIYFRFTPGNLRFVTPVPGGEHRRAARATYLRSPTRRAASAPPLRRARRARPKVLYTPETVVVAPARRSSGRTSPAGRRTRARARADAIRRHAARGPSVARCRRSRCSLSRLGGWPLVLARRRLAAGLGCSSGLAYLRLLVGDATLAGRCGSARCGSAALRPSARSPPTVTYAPRWSAARAAADEAQRRRSRSTTSARHIGQTIARARARRCAEADGLEAEIVVVDDGSTDGSGEAARGGRERAAGARRRAAEQRPLRGPAGGARGRRRRATCSSSTAACASQPGRARASSRAELAARARRLERARRRRHRRQPVRRASGTCSPSSPWRDYFGDPRTTSFGAEDFDRFPKGTTCFLAPRELLLEAFGALRDAATRDLAARERRHADASAGSPRASAIHISPAFALHLHAARRRSRVVPAARASTAASSSSTGTAGASRASSRSSVAFFPRERRRCALAVAAAPGARAGRSRRGGRRRGRRCRGRHGPVAVTRRVAFAALAPVYAVAHGAGMWRGARARCAASPRGRT